jgi:hypothetical protein
MFHEELANMQPELEAKGGGDCMLQTCVEALLFSLKYLECRHVGLVFLINKAKQTSSSIICI